MAEPHILTTLRRKRDEMEAAIRAYEKKTEALRRDLAHVKATLRMFELNGEHEMFPVTWTLRGYLNAARFGASAKRLFPEFRVA